MPGTELKQDTLPNPESTTSRSEAVLIQLGVHSDKIGQWRKRLGKRSINSLAELFGKPKTDPLSWGLPLDFQSTDAADLIARLTKATAGKKRSIAWAAETLPNWLDEAAGREPDIGYAIECLAWCHAARKIICNSDGTHGVELLGLLSTTLDEAAGIELEKSPLLHQLVVGELAVALAYNFPDLKPLRQRAKKARRAIAAGITELLDGEGMPHARQVHLLRPLVASWTRSAVMCRDLRERLLTDETIDGYCWAVQQMIRLTRGDGGQLLDDRHHQMPADFLNAAVKLADDEECTNAAALTGLLGKKAKAKASRYEAPPGGSESEWAASAVMRSSWLTDAVAIAVQHPETDLMVEMCIGSDVLFSGTLNPHVEIDGVVHPPVGDWDQICWYSDDDADYLEVEIKLESGWRVQRQTMLARTDAFALVADAILPPEGDAEAHAIDYRLEVPLTAGWAFRPEEETAEGMILDRTGRPVVLALPLALPEWRRGPQRGKLVFDDGHRLVLSQTHRGSRLFAPLLLDYYSKRMRKQLTWRQLTVADQLQIQSTDSAVGYRVQIGLEQWLIYRSLTEPRNRTVLGHNLTSEFLVARFDDGETEPLVEIE